MADPMALYGRVEPIGTLEPGDGSERCVICGVRPHPSYYVWADVPYPVCGVTHAKDTLVALQYANYTIQLKQGQPLG
jgi:hypothetical protein